MSTRIAIHHRVVIAVSVKVIAVDGVGLEVIDVVFRDKSARFRIVVSRVEVVESRFAIEVITAESERIFVRDMVGSKGNFVTAIVGNTQYVAPSVVVVSSNVITATVHDINNVALDYIISYVC